MSTSVTKVLLWRPECSECNTRMDATSTFSLTFNPKNSRYSTADFSLLDPNKLSLCVCTNNFLHADMQHANGGGQQQQQKKTLPACDDLQPCPTPPTPPLTQHGAAIGGRWC